jgi:hypothetical protein
LATQFAKAEHDFGLFPPAMKMRKYVAEEIAHIFLAADDVKPGLI